MSDNPFEHKNEDGCNQAALAHQKIINIEARLRRGDKSLAALPELLDEVRKLTAEVNEIKREIGQTKDLVTAWGNIKGFGKFMGALSQALKTTAVLATAASALYLLFTHHDHAAQELTKTFRGE